MEVNDVSSKAFKRADTNIHGKLKHYFMTHYSHCLVPGFNLNKNPWIDTWQSHDVIGLQQEFPYNCDLPKPLLPPIKITKNVLNEGDPALQLIATKTHIENDVKRILGQYEKHKKAFRAIPLKKDIKWKEARNNRTGLPRYVADLADMIEMDPDPYFTGMYNWYYTGGALTSLSLYGENHLLFPYMGDLVAAPMVSTKTSLWKPNLRTAASCEMDDIIFETRASMQSDGYRILGRAKNNCIFYSLAENREKVRLIQVHKRGSKVPFVSADLDPVNCNKFCTMNIERTLTLWDMVSCRSIRSNTVDVSKVLEDKWGSVRFMQSDPNTIVFVDRCCVHYLDTRDPYERPVLTLCPKDHLEACENLCSATPSCTDNHNYVASYHSLLMCDRRSPGESVQQKWTHQFKSAPLYVAVQKRGETEVIVLSSQMAGETAIILNTWDGRDNPHSYNLPYTPPSILDTLKESRMQGKCLDPSLRKRLELSTSGLSMAVDKNDNLSLFVQNSIGDVFYQCITHEEPLDNYSLMNCQSFCAMEAWERQILLHERLISPLVITDRTNMHHVFDNFTNKSLRPTQPNVEPSELFGDLEWKQSLQKLKSYVDILAPELLAVWEVTEDNVPVTQTTVPHQKVLNWLEMAGQKDVVESQEDADPMVTPINTQELFSVSQPPDVIDISENIPEEAYYPPVRVKTGRKSQAKKRTYVAGF